MEIYFLVNANSNIGFGHMKRCLLIMEEIRAKNIKCSIITYSSSSEVISNLEKRGIVVLKVDQDFELNYDPSTYINLINKNMDKNTTPLLVIDSDDEKLYHKDFQLAVINAEIKLMYITLNSDLHYYAHIVLNQNILALSQRYSVESYTKKLLGPKYFILDKSFKEITPNIKLSKDPPFDLLVTFGNADPNNLTERIIEIVENQRKLFNKIRIVIGSLNKRKDELQRMINDLDKNIEVHINTNKMYDLMKNCDIAICSAGLTFWEATLHHIPVLLLSGSKREKPVVNYLAKMNYCYYLGSYDDDNWSESWNKRLKKAISRENLEKIKVGELAEKVKIEGVKEIIKKITSLI
jgi:UDP-2,4-diacetamido-2,4,6-trideoxy-beta-L-altropyranose hydrolase